MTTEDNLQRPPAEIRYSDELARLRENDKGDRPPGWRLSLEAARRFIVGEDRQGIRRKFVGDPSLIDRALVSLATNRGLLLVGEVALVLRRKANADVVAVHPTVTLHLPKDGFMDLIREHPAILQGLYLLAVKRDEETSGVLENSTTSVAEDYVLV